MEEIFVGCDAGQKQKFDKKTQLCAAKKIRYTHRKYDVIRESVSRRQRKNTFSLVTFQQAVLKNCLANFRLGK